MMRQRAFVVALSAGALLVVGGYSWSQEAAETTQTPRTRVMSDITDTIKKNGADVFRRYRIVFDYTAGVGRQYTYDAAGTLLQEEALPHGEPHPSTQDFDDAVALVRADRIIGGMVNRIKAVPDGGFALAEGEGKPCGPGSRCVHVLWLSPDRMGLVRWTVVDLVKQAIVYPAYVPPEYAPPSEGVTK